MSKILDELLGEGETELTKEKLLLTLEKLDERLSKLEEDKSYGGVYIDGSPDYVKDYAEELENKRKKAGGN